MLEPVLRRLLIVFGIASVLVFIARADSRDVDQTRAAFLKEIDRPRVELAPKEESSSLKDLTEVKFSFASEASQRVPGILLKLPGDQRRPVVICLHGTGGSKESEQNFLKQFAGRGFIAVSIDGRYHGERGKPADYNAAIANAFEKGGAHPLYWDTVWDVMRLIDYLETRPDVDSKRIGLMGISKGGIETFFASAVDTRIAVSVPCIGVQSFQWALDHDAWLPRVATVRKGFDAAARSSGVEVPNAAFVRTFYDHLLPGVYSRFDGPIMLTLIAPRPLLIINGEKDGLTPLAGVNLCAASARAAYQASGVDERFKQIVEPGAGHTVTTESRSEIIAWFEKWLQPPKQVE